MHQIKIIFTLVFKFEAQLTGISFNCNTEHMTAVKLL